MGRILFFDSFDHYDSAHLTAKWSTSNAGAIAPGAGRSGAALHQSNYPASITKNLPGNYNELIVGAAVKFASLSNGGGVAQTCIGFANTGSAIMSGFGTNAVGAVVAYGSAGNTAGDPTQVQGGSANALVSANQYNYFEYHVNISAGTVVVRLNGVVVINATGLSFSQTQINQVIPYTDIDSGYAWWIDDLYILDPSDSSGGAPNTFLGDVYAGYIPVVAPGAYSQFTPYPAGSTNYNDVDESPPDDDTTFVASNTVGAIDSYKLGDLPATGDIIAVQLLALARKDSAGTRVVDIGFGDGAAPSFTGPDHSLPGTYTYLAEVYPENPLTSAAWVPDANLEIAVKVES